MVQGAGHVGFYLVERLVKEGAKVMVSGINNDRLKKLDRCVPGRKWLLLMPYMTSRWISYAPLRFGRHRERDDTISKLVRYHRRCCNNQLKKSHKHGEALVQRNITYAPDFLINAGG